MCGCCGPRERSTHDVILTMLEKDDGNTNCQKAIVFVVKTTALHVHHAFLVQFLDVHCKATMWNLPMQVLSFKKEVNT